MADHDRPAHSDQPAGEDRPAGESADAQPRDAAKDVQSGNRAPEAPVLVAPQEEALVDGEEVTLRWEAVREADRYLVEVAEDASFHEVVLQQEVDDTSLSLNPLPTEGDLYYWRVLVHREGAWSHGDRIESFVSVTAEQVRAADGEGEAPDRSEGYGPATKLFSAAGAEAAAEATGSEARFAREREMGVAHEGVEAGQIMGLAGGVIVAIVLIVCILLFWVTSVAQSTREVQTETSIYPELQATETRAAEQLSQYELVSEQDSAYRIPIDEAMRIVADEAYEQGPARRYSNELQVVPPTTPADSAEAGPFVPEPSVPEGPAAQQ